MPAPFIIPFNNCPVNTGSTSASYTVPAGKYARVLVNIGIRASVTSAIFQIGSSTAASGGYNTKGEAFNQTIELWCRTGDVITSASTLASGTASVTTTAGVYNGASATATTAATVSLNSVALATFYAVANAAVASSNGTAISYGTWQGAATIIIHFEEFNQIS